jgi:hypothetical protein
MLRMTIAHTTAANRNVPNTVEVLEKKKHFISIRIVLIEAVFVFVFVCLLGELLLDLVWQLPSSDRADSLCASNGDER